MKYFITSDVHSFYTPLKYSLDEAGFDINNKEHILIVNGDLFDRGEETLEVLNFIKSIPKERRILIRGNHEYLLKDLLEKELPESYDFSNGTVLTCFQLAKQSDTDYRYLYYSCDYTYYGLASNTEINYAKRKWKSIVKKVKATKILDWIFDSGEWVNYYELDNYIITHAFIPLNKPYLVHMYHVNTGYLSYKADWRLSTNDEFEQATWGCPYQLFNAGLFNKEIENGKTLICGHWTVLNFRETYLQELLSDKDLSNFEIFYTKHLIGIDGCTALSNKCNVLVIEDGKCYQHNKLLLEEFNLEKYYNETAAK